MLGLIVRSHLPFNAETPLARLRRDFITPQAGFYVRSHGPVPTLSASDHRLQIEGRVARPLNLSMEDLHDGFPIRTVVAVMQCAGNRRDELHRWRPVSGDLWSAGAIGNAAWTGVALADVLKAAGADADPALHVAFEAGDEVEGGLRFGVSIPMAKAVAPDVLLAFAMNGEPLAPEHGFPLRVVVPGFAGIRSPKWLIRITVQDTPSDNPMQQTDYKLMPPDLTAETADWARGMTINEMPLNAAICEPASGAVLDAGPVSLRGYAIGCGRSVERIDVSADRGANWQQAALTVRPETPWSWTFWETSLNLPPGEHELTARAWDAAGQTQPAQPADVWNFKGYLCTAWHRVRVTAV